MSPATLLSLSPELIQAIGCELTQSDVLKLRLTCRTLAELLSAHIYRRVCLDIDRTNMIGGVEAVKTLALGNHVACRAARELVIGVLSPVYDPYDIRGYKFNRDTRLFTRRPPAEAPPEAVISEEKLTSHLLAALASLTGVHTVLWSPSENSNSATHNIVMDVLPTMSNLCRLEICFSDTTFSLDLGSLSGLETLVVSTDKTSPSYQDEIFEGLAKLVAQNPRLCTLDVSVRANFQENQYQSLHHLFKYYPVNKEPLRLRALKLKNLLLRLDDITLPHLAHLHSLKMICIDDPFAPRTKSTNVPTESVVHREVLRKRYGSSLEDIWKALRIAGIHLERITIDKVSWSFLDYISSYSGLTALDLPLGFDHQFGDPDDLAVQFYAGPLDSHAQTLETLRVMPYFDSSWCFGRHNAQAFSNLKQLKYLGVAIRWPDISGWDGISRLTFFNNLIDGILINIPDIQSFQLDCAKADEIFWNSSDPSTTQFDSSVLKSLKYLVFDYRSQPSLSSLQRVPYLTVGKELQFTGKLVEVSDDDDATSGQDCAAESEDRLLWKYFWTYMHEDKTEYWRGLFFN